MGFQISLVAQDKTGIVQLAASGTATATDFPSTNPTHFDNAVGPDWAGRLVLLSMDKTPYIDSSAIGWLIASQKAFRTAGGKLVLHSLQPQVRQILELLKIGRIIPLADDEIEARELIVQKVPAPV